MGNQKMKTIIHVNQHKIRSNKKNNAREHVLSVKTYKSNRYGSNVIIKDKTGDEVARIIYSPDKPLPCGARCWVETTEDVFIDDEEESKTKPLRTAKGP